MARAFAGLRTRPDWVCVDGRDYPDIACPGETIIQGDQLIAEISAASIIAKVHRDREMQFLDSVYPGYEFSRHKGYPTRLHLQKLEQLGVTRVHRKSFAPVKNYLSEIQS